MKGFKIDNNGDVIIQNRQIEMTDGNDLIRQTIQTVLGTNKGEWDFNPDEGITFDYILTKNPDFDVIRNEIANGLTQVDDTLVLQDFKYDYNKNQRTLHIDFTARNSNGEEVSGSYTF